MTHARPSEPGAGSSAAADRPASTRGAAEQLVDGLDQGVALLIDRHLDVLAASAAARAMCPGLSEGANVVRLGVLAVDRGAHRDAGATHSDLAALLREAITTSSEDDRFVEIVGELVATSRGFAVAWAESRGARTSGRVRLDTASGTFSLAYLRIPLAGDDRTVLLLAQAPGRAADADVHRMDRHRRATGTAQPSSSRSA